MAHGLRRWSLGVVHLWLSILYWLRESLWGLHAFLKAGDIFMKGLGLSSVYTHLDLRRFVGMISSRAEK